MCGSSDVKPFLDLNPQPPANSFIKPEQFAKENHYPLVAYFCGKCNLAQLLDIVDKMPKSVNVLQATSILNPGQSRKYGEYLISMINSPIHACSGFKPIPRSLSGQKLDYYRALKKVTESIAQEWNIAPELLGKKRLLEHYITMLFAEKNMQHSVQLPEEFGAWRIKLLSGPFEKIAESKFNV